MLSGIVEIDVKERYFWLSSFFPVVVGILLFLLNSKYLLNHALLLAIIMMILPAVLYTLRYADEHPIRSLALVFIPIVFINYIYFLTQGDVVGFNDPHLHINQYLNIIPSDGAINKDELAHISFYFVGLYILFKTIEVISSLPIEFLAAVIPPALNCVCIFTVFVIVTRLHTAKIGIIAMLFFGWDLYVLHLGQEFRTQTLGTLLLFMIFVLILTSARKFKSSGIAFTLSSFPILIGIVMSSFVSYINAVFVLVFTFLASLSLHHGLNFNRIKWALGVTTLLSLFILFFLYVFNITGDYSVFFETLRHLGIQLSSGSDLSAPQGSGATESGAVTYLYGSLIQYLTYGVYILFISSSVYYLYIHFREKATLHLSIYLGFSSLLLFLFGSVFFGGLSTGRVYVLILFLFAMCTAYMLNHVRERHNRRGKSDYFRYVIVLIIFLNVVISVGKLPQYVVGEITPIRNDEPIDNVTYWDRDIAQKTANAFVDEHAGLQHYSVDAIIIRYYALGLTTKLNQQDDSEGSLMLLHDKFYNKYYQNRALVKSADDFRNNDKVYSNADYLIFLN